MITDRYPDWAALPFEERQKRWGGELRTFRQLHGRQDRPNVWQIEVRGDRVHTQHGLLGGQMQTTDYIGKLKNAGKKNEISPAQDALAEARRDARKKWDFAGYDEYVGDTNIDHRHQDISIQSLLTNLPGSFCLYKPENNIRDQKKLWAKADKGEAFFTLKRDGVAKLIVVDYYGHIVIYSRRARAWQDKEGPKENVDGTLDYSTVVPWAARFPHLIDSVKRMNLPNGTMLACELATEGPDNFPYVSGLTKGYTDRALADMAAGGLPILYCWDIPFYGGEDWVKTKPYRERYAAIHGHWAMGSSGPEKFYVHPIAAVAFANTSEAEAHAKSLGIEGYVVVDPDATYGDKGWNLKGKPDRPTTVAKLKPRSEDDFVAYWDPDNKVGEWGEGRNERGKTVTLPDGSQVVHGGVGSVALYQYNAAGELVFTSNCSGGMDYAFQSRLKKEDFPFVCQVEYVGRTYVSDEEKTNALRHPVFLRVRDDKRPEECVNDRL